MDSIVVSNILVKQDKNGRFCLNDLHRAAMGQGKATKSHRPGSFLKRPETIALINAIKKRCTAECITPVLTVKGNKSGIEQGTFVSKTLVYAYAMWIDADFHLDVIEAFDSSHEAQKNLWQQMQALITKEVSSQVRASFGSKLMLSRKKEIPRLKSERDLIESKIQPSLLTH
ncbi:KilA-N domain-containing protein [Undibacterium sp. MH2W]|uniref:KilA-N domain-containing protein n=1 Tax=Undibacterium sp. MH2W TaxID=3413044 RepID=UPI003BF024E0